MPYQDPVIAKYIELFKASNVAILEYYQGDPIRVPTTNLPCAVISKQKTRVGVSTNAEDERAMALRLTVIVDVRNDLSTQESIPQVTGGLSTLYDIIEGMNADLTLKDTSLLYILRHNILVDATHGLRTDLSSITEAEFGITALGQGENIYRIEGHVDFVAGLHQVR